MNGLSFDHLSVPIGDLVTFIADHGAIDFTPAAGQPIISFADDGGLGVQFSDGIPVLSGWGGSVGGFAIDSSFRPIALDGFHVDVTIPEGLGFGLPTFLPLHVDKVGMSFPDVGPGGLLTDISNFRIRLSGGLNIVNGSDGQPLFPIAASVDGLELDLHKLVTGEFPFTNLNGITFGVAPFDLGGLKIGGEVSVGSIPVDSTTVFYARITGEFEMSGLGAGIDLVITDLGPVVAEVSAPLGIPIGPTGILLSGVQGGVVFGAKALDEPDPKHPEALLTMPLFQQLGNFEIDRNTIAGLVTDAVHGQTATWNTTITLELTATLTAAEAPMVEGAVTVGANIGHGAVDLLAKGDLTVFGFPMGEAGMRVRWATR